MDPSDPSIHSYPRIGSPCAIEVMSLSAEGSGMEVYTMVLLGMPEPAVNAPTCWSSASIKSASKENKAHFSFAVFASLQ
eukprot:scaffold87945_cov16-Tisochrysis_lutea.AAC.2